MGRGLVLAVALAVVAAAQEDVVIRPLGNQYGFRDGEDFVWVFLGGVEVEQGPRRMRGETLVAVLARDEAGATPAPADPSTITLLGGRLRELYLEGPVDLFEGGDSVVGAGALHLDSRTGEITIWDGEWRTQFAEGPLVVRFAAMRQLAGGDKELHGLSYTSCTHAVPHWHVETDWAVLRTTPEERTFRTGDSTARVGGVPFLWWPGLDLDLDDTRVPIQSLDIGSSSRFGAELVVGFGGDASELYTGIGRLLGVDRPVRGDWTLTTGLYSERGLFLEPLFEYETEATKGELLLSFINDSADEDHLEQPITDSSRGRIDWQQRTWLRRDGFDEYTILDAELSYLSDENFLEEYYRREFRDGKEQETYLYWRDVSGNTATTALVRQRLNDFDSQVEYAPEIERRTVGEPMDVAWLGGAYVSVRDLVSQAKSLPGDDVTGMDVEGNTRVGRRVQLDWPFDVGGDRLRVSAGADLMGFAHTLEQGSDIRRALFGEVSWTQSWVGVDREARDETWNIDGLRHVLEPTLGFRSVFAQNLEPADLVPIDDEEMLAPVKVLSLLLRHRLQTHQGGRVATLLDTQVLLPFFPEQEQDNAGEVDGDSSIDVRWTPGANLPLLHDSELRWRSVWDQDGPSYEQSYVSFEAPIDEARRFFVADNKTRDVFHFATLGVQWLLESPWAVAVFWQQDLEEHETARAGVALRQTAHCWLIDYIFETERGDSTVDGSSGDDVRVTLRFTPAILKHQGDYDLLDQIASRIR